MELIFTLAIIYFIFTLVAIFKWPELALGVQLFGKPIFTMALNKLGIGVGAAYFILSLTLLSFLIYQRKPRCQGIFRFTNIEIAMLLLLIWGTISLTFTPSPNYGAVKITHLALIGIPIMISARLFTSSAENLKLTLQVLGWYAIFTLFIITIFVVLVGTGSTGIRLKSAYFGVLGLGYSAAAMSVFACYIAITGNVVSKSVALFSILYSSIVLIIGSGSRGPVLAFVVAIALTFLRGKQIVRTLSIAGVFTAVIYFVAINFASETGLARITGENESGSKSTETRIHLFEAGVNQFLDHPIIGQGTGSFSDYFLGRDVKSYPHNYFIEVSGELGLIGLSLFLIAMYLCATNVWRVRRYVGSGVEYGFWEITIIQILFFAGFLTAMVSFDFSKQRLFYTSIGLIAAISQWNWQTTQETSSTFAANTPTNQDDGASNSTDISTIRS